jgi:hypothetical protein
MIYESEWLIFVGMIVYSVTVSVELSEVDRWLDWMQAIHIPAVIQTGFFTSYRVCVLLEPISETESKTFNIQYTAENKENYLAYLAGPAPGLQKEHLDHFPKGVYVFRTLLETI